MTNMIISSVGEDLAQLELIYTVRTVKWQNHVRKNLGVSYKVQLMLTYDSAILLLGIYPKEMKIFHVKVCTQMFLEAVSIIHQNMRTTWISLTMMGKQIV